MLVINSASGGHLGWVHSEGQGEPQLDSCMGTSLDESLGESWPIFQRWSPGPIAHQPITTTTSKTGSRNLVKGFWKLTAEDTVFLI